MPTRSLGPTIASVIGAFVATVAIGVAQQAPTPAVLQSYQPVTAERLKNPEAGNWLMIRRTYDGWGYSPLDRSRRRTSRAAAGLGISTGEARVHEAAPHRQQRRDVHLHAQQPGDRHRRQDRQRAVAIPEAARRGRARASRPAAASRSTATRSTTPPAKPSSWRSTRRPARRSGPRTVADNKSGYYISLAPLVADGKVMVGASGGEFGMRGFVAALDPDTGKELWRTYTIPAPGEPGSETWPKGDQWKTGGGSDLGDGQLRSRHEHRLLGHRQRRSVDGRPAPRRQPLHRIDHRDRRRDRARSRATSSITPNESWDWDEVSPPILVDYRRNGRTIKGLIDVARDGYLWFLERSERADQVSSKASRTCIRTCSAASIR